MSIYDHKNICRVHQTSKKYMASDSTFLREGIYEFNVKILSISRLAFLTYLGCFPIFCYIRTRCMSPYQSYLYSHVIF
ncbi:Os10g0107600 [Oryza sativa Japonica Group]|uniref:Os10g0107600 protein n=1 Tax=Oryza sativa subsp. japonica TaxID=39947 RepID=C7J7Y7_ORYSJ|nr:Os10g0107600 [Oryza sativa Japonica Group]|eukprot:NP_001176005.1 Os10g0107600 [Oryza sativa Japonica Group]